MGKDQTLTYLISHLAGKEQKKRYGEAGVGGRKKWGKKKRKNKLTYIGILQLISKL